MTDKTNDPLNDAPDDLPVVEIDDAADRRPQLRHLDLHVTLPRW